MRSMGPYCNSMLHKHRLPPFIEWQEQITDIRRAEPSAFFFPYSFDAKRIGPRVRGWVSPEKAAGLGRAGPAAYRCKVWGWLLQQLYFTFQGKSGFCQNLFLHLGNQVQNVLTGGVLVVYNKARMFWADTGPSHPAAL